MCRTGCGSLIAGTTVEIGGLSASEHRQSAFAFLGRIDRAKVNPGIDVLKRLARVLKARLVEIFVGPPPKALAQGR